MENGKTIGLIMFIGAVILLIIYGIVQDFSRIVESFDYISGLLVGIMILGIIVLLISIFFEQRKDNKKNTKDIKKEDLEP